MMNGDVVGKKKLGLGFDRVVYQTFGSTRVFKRIKVGLENLGSAVRCVWLGFGDQVYFDSQTLPEHTE